MSTRALVVVDFGDHVEYRYNHCDGYPSYLGSFLRKHMKDLPTIQSIFNEHKDWSWIEYGNDKPDGITAGYYEDDACDIIKKYSTLSMKLESIFAEFMVIVSSSIIGTTTNGTHSHTTILLLNSVKTNNS